jgi:hypothetical protein
LKEAAFVRGGRGGALWDFNRFWLGSYWKEEYLWDERQSWAHLFSHDAKATNGLMVTRDTSFFKTYCYLIASLESSMSLASGHAEASAAKRLRPSRLIGNAVHPKPPSADNDEPVTPTDTKVSIDTIVQLFRLRSSGLIASVYRIGINRRWGQFC